MTRVLALTPAGLFKAMLARRARRRNQDAARRALLMRIESHMAAARACAPRAA